MNRTDAANVKISYENINWVDLLFTIACKNERSAFAISASWRPHLYGICNDLTIPTNEIIVHINYHKHLKKKSLCLSFVCYMLKNCHVSFECEPDCFCVWFFRCLYCALFVHNSVNIIIHSMESNKVRKTCIATTSDGYLHSYTHTSSIIACKKYFLLRQWICNLKLFLFLHKCVYKIALLLIVWVWNECKTQMTFNGHVLRRVVKM